MDKTIAKINKAQDHHQAANKWIDEMVEKASTYLPMLRKAQADPQIASLGDTISIAQAVLVEKHGVQAKDCKFDKYNDHTLTNRRAGGKANGNTVDKFECSDGKSRFFKPEECADRGGGSD